MKITEACTDVERRKVQRLLSTCIPDIPENAVPSTQMDPVMAPVVVQVQDPETGQVVGGALSCRAPLAITAIAAEMQGRSTGYRGVIKRHSMLDLLGVHPEYRKLGIGRRVVTFMEERLREKGIRAWFGLVEDELEVEQLRRFYSQQGFVVLQRGQMLPPLLGKELWAGSTVPAFFFYKLLKN